MAFFNRVGSLLKQNVSANALNGQMNNASMLNAIRCMSSKLFIGGLSYETDDQSLKEAFEAFGEVMDAKVITDRETGRSRGFGFVNFTNEESATSAVSAMDGQQLSGRNIRVSIAQERAPRNFGSGGYGGNSGGYGGNSGGYGGNSGGYGGNGGGY